MIPDDTPPVLILTLTTTPLVTVLTVSNIIDKDILYVSVPGDIVMAPPNPVSQTRIKICDVF